MKTITNKFKIALVTAGMLAVGTVSAQTAPGAAVNIAKQGNATPGTTNTSVKVIDNKGTIKYLQSNNGITMLTNTTADRTTTTWQLGGTLTDDTYIDASGAVFAIDGVKLITAADVAATAATGGSTHLTSTDTGYTLLVRDEVTGETKKMLASDLVSGVRREYEQVADATGATDTTLAINVPGLPVLTAMTTFAKLFVYRNGAKLRSGTDFVATADTVTITYDADELPMYAGDVIEIQYIK